MESDPFAGVPAFVAAAERKSFRDAAADLGITSAAISKSVSRLEDELGVRLLDRTTRRVEPTAEGRLYLEYCKQALAQMRTARDRVEQARATAAGELVIALPFILGPSVMDLLPEFNQRYPALSVRLTLSDRPSKLVDEKIDVALRIGQLDATTTVARKLSTTRWITVASPAYLSKRGQPHTPADLSDHDCIVYRSPRGFDVDWEFFARPGSTDTKTFTPSARITVDQGQLMVDGARAGAGIAHVFTFMVQDELKSGALVPLLVEFAPEGPPLHALFKPGHQDDAKVRAFVDFAVEKFSPQINV